MCVYVVGRECVDLCGCGENGCELCGCGKEVCGLCGCEVTGDMDFGV